MFKQKFQRLEQRYKISAPAINVLRNHLTRASLEKSAEDRLVKTDSKSAEQKQSRDLFRGNVSNTFQRWIHAQVDFHQ